MSRTIAPERPPGRGGVQKCDGSMRVMMFVFSYGLATTMVLTLHSILLSAPPVPLGWGRLAPPARVLGSPLGFLPWVPCGFPGGVAWCGSGFGLGSPGAPPSLPGLAWLAPLPLRAPLGGWGPR